MANPALYITDGTTEVQLLRGPFKLTDWRPARAPLKGGGTWRSSPFVDGRRLVAFRRDNIVDTFSLLVQGYTQDELIYVCQEADRLLTKAMQYWSTSWQDEPVYLVARGHGETNARYTHIHSYAFPNAANPYVTPFAEGTGLILAQEDLTVVIEHGSWLQFPPTGHDCTLISAENDYNSRTYGRDSTDVCVRVEAIQGYILKEDGDHILLELGPPDALLLEGMPYEVYVVNKTNMANLTHIWQYRAVGPAWANLIDAIPPTTGLFNAAIGAAVGDGDIIYFCIDSAVDDSGPFCSLVFDIDTAAIYAAGATLIWEYPPDAGGWALLPTRDNTLMFQSTFVNSVHWNPPTDWDQTENVNGTVGYAVRCRVVLNGGTLMNPSQQNRRIYTITWPRYDLAAGDIGGDIVALVRTTADNQASDGASPNRPFNKMWLGLRSLDRGDNFVMHLNAANEQNPAGITYTTSGVLTVDDRAPTGWHSFRTVTNVNPLTVTWSMDNTIMPDFWGTYHAFVRGRQNAGVSGDALIQIITQSVFGAATTHLWSSNQVPFQTNNNWELVDMGRVSLPPIGIAHPTFDIFNLLVEVTDAVAGSTDVKLYDLILLPIDEWAGSFSNTETNAEVDEGLFLDVNSISDPKRLITAVNRVAATGNIFTAYQVIANDHALVQANATQRMYHLFADDKISYPCISCAVWLFTNQQYLNMRGNR